MAFGLSSSLQIAHTIVGFPLQAVDIDIRCESTRSSSQVISLKAVMITQSVMRLTGRHHAAVLGSADQSQSLSCSCHISLVLWLCSNHAGGQLYRGEGVLGGESSLRATAETYFKRTGHAIDKRGGTNGLQHATV